MSLVAGAAAAVTAGALLYLQRYRDGSQSAAPPPSEAKGTKVPQLVDFDENSSEAAEGKPRLKGETSERLESTVLPGLHLHIRKIAARTPGRPKGVVLVYHGVGEHSHRPGYDLLMNRLADAGYRVFAMDHQGHGRSQGKRLHFETVSHLFDDAVKLLDHVEENENVAGLPVFVFGHSMGGLIAFNVCSRRPDIVRAAAFSGPALAPPEVPSAVRSIIEFLAKSLPLMPIFQLDVSGLASDPAVGQEARADPLYQDSALPSRVASELGEGMRKATGLLATYKTPTFVAHGENDTLVPLIASLRLIDETPRLDASLKTRHIYKGKGHELLHEDIADDFCDRIIQFYDSHLSE